MKRSIIAILIAVCAILSGCRNHGSESGYHHEDIVSHDHEHEGEGHEPGEIVVSEERQHYLGISVETVSKAPFSEVIHTSGQIVSSSGDEAAVVARSSGIVNIGTLAEGSAVKKNSCIAVISSKGIGGGDQVAKAKAIYEAAKKEYERDLQLRDDNIVSESHLDQSRLAYEQASVEYEALAGEGLTENGVKVSSPIDGFIKSLDVRQGGYVEAGTLIATVSQNRRLRLRVDISQKYYSLIPTIQDAVFKTESSSDSYSVKELGGRLLSYGRTTEGDPYIPATFEFDNRGQMIPGSYVEAYLKTSVSCEAISVPETAILEEQGTYSVFVQTEPDAFIKREVKLGQSDGKRVLIKSGLSEGETIAATGALHIKLSAATAIPHGHSHNH